jgi:hypothetical protein
MDLVRDRRGIYVEVDPYRSGWIRHTVLTESALWRNDVVDLQRVVSLIDVRQHSYNIEFVEKKTKGVYAAMNYRLHTIMKDRFELVIPEELQKYFRMNSRYLEYSQKTQYYYEFAYDNLVEFEVLDNIVTHHFIPDGEAASRIDYLHKKLWRTDEGMLNKAMGWFNYRERDENKKRDFLTRSAIGDEVYGE